MRQENRWKDAGKALQGIAEEAGKYDTNGIDIHFLNSDQSRRGLKVRLTKV